MKCFAWCAAVVMATASTVHATSAFDGSWMGEAPFREGCGVWTFHFTIRDGTLGGTVTGLLDGKQASGTVQYAQLQPDGNADIIWGFYHRFRGNFRFSGNNLTGNFIGPCGELPVVGHKT